MKKKKMHYLSMLNFVVVGNVLWAILVIGIIVGFVYSRYMENEVISLMESNVEQTTSYIEGYLGNITNMANQLAMDVELGNAVEDYFSSDIVESVQGKKGIDYILQSSMGAHSYIENITIGAQNKVIMRDRYTMDRRCRMDEILEEDWYKDLQQEKLNYKFTENVYYQDADKRTPCYLYATKFKNKFFQTRNQEDRVITITFNTEELEKYVSTISNNASININILDQNEDGGNIIYQSFEDEKIASYLTGSLTDNQRDKVGKKYVFKEREISDFGWKVAGCIKYSTLYRIIYRIDPWMVLMVAVVLLVSITSSIISSRVVSKPMEELAQAMTGLQDAQFCHVKADTGCIEMEQLMTTYNKMAEQIEEQIADIRLREKEKRKIEFKMLEAQINPHFIYNTLDTVKWVARMNHADKIGDIIESFVRLLRISLSEGNEIIPVDNEITLVQEYANIMIFRNNYNIEITYDIEPETRTCNTLKLVLQPFVENSFFHAFEDGKNKERCIKISSRLDEDALIFEVRDNGVGFWNEDKRHKKMTGIGIDNVDDRIKAWYGDEYGIKIISQKDRGTKVTVRQPIMRKGEEYDTGNDSGR